MELCSCFLGRKGAWCVRNGSIKLHQRFKPPCNSKANTSENSRYLEGMYSLDKAAEGRCGVVIPFQKFEGIILEIVLTVLFHYKG